MDSGTAVEVVAEIANAHQGSPQIARELAIAAVKSGAQAIKFQIYSADELLVPTHPRYDHFKQQAFSADIWSPLLAEAMSLGVPVYADVFGLPSLEIAKQAGLAGIKIHSSDIGNDPLIEAAAASFPIVHLGVGGATAREIDHALQVIGRVAPAVRPVLLHGFQSYPTAVEDSCLNRISWLSDNFGAWATVGYMDHVAGESFFASALPLMAIAKGARVIEKHITLDRSQKGVDYYSSLNPDEFARFVEQVTQAVASLGTGPTIPSAAEIQYRKTVRKHWVAARDIVAGEVIRSDMVSAKRVEAAELHTLPLSKILGRVARLPIAKDTLVSRRALKIKAVALVVARTNSKRLTSKALLPVQGLPTIEHLLRRVQRARSLESTILCTTTLAADDALADIGYRLNIPVVRGANDNVLERMCSALEGSNADLALRITGDDILIDPAYIDSSIEYHLSTHSEYSALKDVPSGFDFEIFDVDLLRELYARATDSSGTEYLTLYITDHAHQFAISRIPVPPEHKRTWRLTLDTAQDLKLITAVLDEMHRQGHGLTYSLSDVVSFLETNPSLLSSGTGQGGAHHVPTITTDLRWLSSASIPNRQ